MILELVYGVLSFMSSLIESIDTYALWFSSHSSRGFKSVVLGVVSISASICWRSVGAAVNMMVYLA